MTSGGPEGPSRGPKGPPSPPQVLERRGAVGPPNFLVLKMGQTQQKVDVIKGEIASSSINCTVEEKKIMAAAKDSWTRNVSTGTTTLEENTLTS